jgi:DNA-binding transcriptional ArsR family regulator
MVNQSESLDLVFHALSDSTRRSMVKQLCRGPASVSELARPLSMTLPAVVQHIAVLENCGLVRTKKVGRTRTCTLEARTLSLAEKWIADRKASWETKLDQLEHFLGESE